MTILTIVISNLEKGKKQKLKNSTFDNIQWNEVATSAARSFNNS